MREHQRDFVNRGNIFGGDDRALFNVAEESNFALDVFREKTIRPTKQNIGLNSNAEQFFYRVLCRLGF